MNLSTVKWAQWDKTHSREMLGPFICVCIALCTTVVHNIARNRPDNFPSYPPNNHQTQSRHSHETRDMTQPRPHNTNSETEPRLRHEKPCLETRHMSSDFVTASLTVATFARHLKTHKLTCSLAWTSTSEYFLFCEHIRIVQNKKSLLLP